MPSKKSLRWKEIPENLKDRVIDNRPDAATYLKDHPELSLGKGELLPGLEVEAFILPMKKAKRSKYGNKKVFHDNHWFDSIKEKDYYCELKLRVMSGEITGYELRPEFPFYASYYQPTGVLIVDDAYTKKYKYVADFRVFYPDGMEEIVDVKGDYKQGQTREFRRKKMIIEKLYGIKIKIV